MMQNSRLKCKKVNELQNNKEVKEKNIKAADEIKDTEKRYPKESGSLPEREVLSAAIPTSEIGIISKDTKIVGDIFTRGHLEISGIIEGNIDAAGNVTVSGRVSGDIKCGNFLLNSGFLKTNIMAREDVSLGEKSQIEGDIHCRSITVAGTVTGNIYAQETVSIAETAAVRGSIAAKGLTVGMGAVLNGSIKMGK